MNFTCGPRKQRFSTDANDLSEPRPQGNRCLRASVRDYIVLMRIYLLMSGRLATIPATTTATAKTLKTFDMLI